jgi:hypothetical protein
VLSKRAFLKAGVAAPSRLDRGGHHTEQSGVAGRQAAETDLYGEKPEGHGGPILVHELRRKT